MVGRGAEGAAAKRPLHKLPLLYKAGKGVVTRGQTGSAAVGTLANGQLYALLLSPDADSRDHSDDDVAALGSTSSSSSGSANSAAAVH
eukprot:1806-Heterococcus_DN1.PRE.1